MKYLFLFKILLLSSILTACQDGSAFQQEFEKGFRESFVKEGIESCIKSSQRGEAARAFCECSVKQVEQNLSSADIQSFAKDQAPKDMAQRLKHAAQTCSKK